MYVTSPSSKSADEGTTKTSFASLIKSSAFAVIPAISFELPPSTRMVVGITLSVDPPPFSSPVGDIFTTSPSAVSPSRISAVMVAICPTFTLPMDELLGGIMEILMLTMERYFTHDSTMELTDNICEVLMRVVIRNSQIIMDEPNNYEARANVMWASALAHNDLTGCGNGWGDLTVHNMQKELLGMYNVPQGIALAMSWAAWAKYVYKADVFRFYRYGRTVWNLPRDFGTQEDIAKEAITFTEDIFRAMGMLGERARQQVGDVVFDTETLTDRVMDGESQIGTFKVLTREEVKDIFDDAVSYLE